MTIFNIYYCTAAVQPTMASIRPCPLLAISYFTAFKTFLDVNLYKNIYIYIFYIYIIIIIIFNGRENTATEMDDPP